MDRSLVNDAKAIKNPVELEGMRQCHLRDAAALCHYFAWLEDQLGQGKQLSEVEAADYLENLRRQQKDFVGLSFDTISSTGPNGAIIHYKPEPETCKIIDPKLIYLCDSGGQYKDGTTDVTRTYHFGQPNDYEKRCFTRVLQGHIAIDRAVFPIGTTGKSTMCLENIIYMRIPGRETHTCTSQATSSILLPGTLCGKTVWISVMEPAMVLVPF
jgi:Xaa-Pro aminopeptidase